MTHNKDTTIVAAAIPRITDHFKALDDGTCSLSSLQDSAIDRSRSWMVRKCLPTHHLQLPTCIWQMLLRLLHQNRLFDSDRDLRVWIPNLWNRTYIDSSHSRASDCRDGLRRDFLRGPDCHRLLCPFAPTTNVYRTCRGDVRRCFDCR